MEAPKNQLEQVLVLLGLYLKSDKTKDALRLLERVKPKFTQAGAESIWTFWYARILAVQGKPEKALKEADREKDPSARQRIRTMVLREVAHHSGE